MYTRSAQRWVLALASVASFMVALDALVVSTALSTIRTDLNASISQLEWTVNAYILSFAVLIMPATALGDRLGRRRAFAAGVTSFAGASAICALAPGVDWLIAGRAVQGVGAALVMPAALALLSGAVPPQRRAWAMGIFSSITGFAVLCGPLLGGAIVQGISWPWIFWLNLPIAAFLIPAARARITESYGPARSLDVRGLPLVTAGAFGLVWGLVRGNSAGWASTEVKSALALGALLTVAFVVCELRVSEPMLPLRLFCSRGFSAGNAAAFFWSAALLGTVFFISQFLQTALGYGPLGAGLLLMPWGATTFVVPQFAGRLIKRFGGRSLITGGLALQAACTAWIALLAGSGVGYAPMIAPLTLAGTGFAIAIPAIQNAVMGSVPPEHIGRASGTLNTMRQLGSAFGVAIAAAVFASTGSYASPQAFTDGFAPAMGTCAGLALLGALAGLALPRARMDAGSGSAVGQIQLGQVGQLHTRR